MKVSNLYCYALSGCVAVMLAACSGGGPQSGVAPSLGRAQPFIGIAAPGATHSGYSKSWVSPDLKKELHQAHVMFLSDAGSSDVYLFGTRRIIADGFLGGFSLPQGVCSDNSKVWIVDFNLGAVYEYSHNGELLKSIGNLSVPIGCAVYKPKGLLAVTTNGAGVKLGSVLIFQNGNPDPVGVGINPNMGEWSFPVFDNRGNLYVDGFDTSFKFAVQACGKFTPGNFACRTMTLSGVERHAYAGGLNWDYENNQLIISDPQPYCICLYQATISGSSATVTGTVKLLDYKGNPCTLYQGALAPSSSYYVGGCTGNSQSISTANRWNFPAGGVPTSWSGGVNYPVSAAISR